MKPVLIVEGKKHDVGSVHYYEGKALSVTVEIDGVGQFRRLDEENVELVWEGRYEPVIEAIHKRIDGEEENQTDRAIQYIQNKGLNLIYNPNLQEEYNKKSFFIDGLTEALGIVDKVAVGEIDD